MTLEQRRLHERARNKRKRQRSIERARGSYLGLIAVLGDCCAFCKKTAMDVLLTIDHMDGRTYALRALRYDARVKRYWQEFQLGVRLRVLCLPCNSLDGALRKVGSSLDTMEVPF